MHHRGTEDTEISSLCALCVSVVSYIEAKGCETPAGQKSIH